MVKEMEIAHVASISLEYEMKEGIKQHDKRCPVCKKEYPEEDNYCGDDGSALEQVRAAGSKHLSRSAEAPTTANEGTAERNGLQ